MQLLIDSRKVILSYPWFFIRIALLEPVISLVDDQYSSLTLIDVTWLRCTCIHDPIKIIVST